MPRIARKSFDDEKMFRTFRGIALTITVAWVGFLVFLCFLAYQLVSKL